MRIAARARIGRLVAVVVAALLAVLAVPGTANASISGTTTAGFSAARALSGFSDVRYCGGPDQAGCPGDFVRVSWGDAATFAGQTRLDFRPGAGVTGELGAPFRVGDLHFWNTDIAPNTAIDEVELGLSIEVTDEERGSSFVAAVPLVLDVDVTANDGPGCPYNPSPPCADAILLPPAPAVPARYEVGGAVYQLDVLGFEDRSQSSGASSRLVAQERTDVVGALLVRVTRTLPFAADAGPDQSVDEGAPVTLDGGRSAGQGLTYSWSQISGPGVALDDPSAPSPTFTAPAVAEDTDLEFELAVAASTDPAVVQRDTVAVRVRNVNQPPVLSMPAGLTVPATAPEGAVVDYDIEASDPDGDPTTVGCTPDRGSAFPIGTTTVDCTAVDGHGASTAGSFDVTVRGAREQLGDLLVAVAGLGPGRSLEAKIRAAVAWLPDRALPLACGPLRAFVNEVGAQSGTRIPADNAATLVEDATRIRAVLACR